MTEWPDVTGRPLDEALKILKEAGAGRAEIRDITADRAQAWPLVRVIRQQAENGCPVLTVCRFPGEV